jgi:hypothetical protein
VIAKFDLAASEVTSYTVGDITNFGSDLSRIVSNEVQGCPDS